MDKYIDEYISKADWRVKENSNTVFSAGGLKNLLAETSIAKYALNMLPKPVSNAHKNHLMHIHDLGNFNMVYCVGWSVKDILLNGLRVGTRFPSSGPAQHFGTALEHILNHCFIHTNEASGAMAYSSVDVFLAPFIKEDKLNYKQVKQQVQRLVFALSQKYRSGLQSPFSNITLDLAPLGSMKCNNVIVGGKELDYTYADCQKEIDMFNKAFCEVMSAGDYDEKPFSFPIPTYSITKDFDWNGKTAKMLFTMASKSGIPYFSNFVNSTLDPEDVRSMAIMPTQLLVYKSPDGRIRTSSVDKLYKNYTSNKLKNYKMLMNGKFVDMTEMFKINYGRYDQVVTLNTEDNISQTFSWDHKTLIHRDGEIKTVYSQEVQEGDYLIRSLTGYESETSTETLEAGRIVGIFLGEGWIESKSSNEITLAINIHREDLVKELQNYFETFACKVFVDKQIDKSIYRVSIKGTQAVAFIKQFIKGKNAKTKSFTCMVWNTSLSFRRGIYEGLLETDGYKPQSMLTHTTSTILVDELIKLCNSIGISCYKKINDKNTRYFKEDKSDLIHFTSYKALIKSDTKIKKVFLPEYEEAFELVKITSVDFSNRVPNFVYNFTVNTKDHLYELPNGIVTHQCCRLRLDKRELINNGGGLFGAGENTGSIGVVTLDLPRLAYMANNPNNWKVFKIMLTMNRKTIKKFYRSKDKKIRLLILIEYTMEQAKESLVIKRKYVEKNLQRGLFPYTRVTLDNYSDHFNTIGIVGMNEALLNFGYDDGIATTGKKLAENIMDFMLEKLKDFQEEYTDFYTMDGRKKGLLFNFEASPSEGAGYKLAKYDKEYFGKNFAVSNNIADADPYYTNSTWLPADSILNDNIFDILDHQDSLQEKYTSGTVLHVYTTGKLSWEKGRDIIQKAFTNYKLPYMSLSPMITICPIHGRLDGEYEYCPFDHTPEEIERIKKLGGEVLYDPLKEV